MPPQPRPARSGSCSSRALCAINTAKASESNHPQPPEPLHTRTHADERRPFSSTGTGSEVPTLALNVAGDAFLQLGSLAHSSGEWNEAQHYFEQALRVAETHADRASSDLARCNVGLTQGNMEFESFLSQVGNQ